MAKKDEGLAREASLVRILGKDISGRKSLKAGLTSIQGISWAYANAICKCLGIDGKRKVGEISEEEIKKIEESASRIDVPFFIKNRQKDFDTGENKHLIGSDLQLRKEFDIKRLRKIKSYRGVRHQAKLPVRGQRTRSNFRRDRRKSGAIGVRKKKK